MLSDPAGSAKALSSESMAAHNVHDVSTSRNFLTILCPFYELSVP